MAIAVDSRHAPRLLHITADGAWPTVKELRDLWEGLIHEGLLTADTRALIDIRAVADTPHYDGVETLIAAAERHACWPLRRAYLVGSPSQYGVVRQMQAMAPTTVQIDIFNVESEALAWLTSA